MQLLLIISGKSEYLENSISSEDSTAMVASQIWTVSEDDESAEWLVMRLSASSGQEPGRRAQAVGPDAQVQFVHISLVVLAVRTVWSDARSS